MTAKRGESIFGTGRWLLVAALFLVWVGQMLPATALAREMVSGRYLSGSGEKIVLELDIASPPPGSLIIHQYLPAGVEISRAEPPVKKYNSTTGTAKWFFKKVKAGKMRVVMELDRSLGQGAVRAELRCRDQQTGEMVQVVVTP